jgi:hypothetical protein
VDLIAIRLFAGRWVAASYPTDTLTLDQEAMVSLEQINDLPERAV